MANNKRKNLQRPLMENLYIDNLTNDTTEEDISAILGLDSATNIRENSLAKKQYRDNGSFAYMFGCPNSFRAQWTELQEQRPCYSAAYRNDEVTAEW